MRAWQRHSSTSKVHAFHQFCPCIIFAQNWVSGARQRALDKRCLAFSRGVSEEAFMTVSRRLLGAILLWLIAGLNQMSAQVTTATILGTVTDSTGAIVPGISITIRNVETGITGPLLPMSKVATRPSSLWSATIKSQLQTPGS